MKARVLVTGGAGFIGSHLTDYLIGRGLQVTVLDDLSTGCVANLADATRHGDVRFVEGSVLDQAALTDALKDCGTVFHLAVQCVRRSLGHPLQNHEINATGTLLTLEMARQAGVERFVYCSSSEVYGNTSASKLVEDVTNCAPVTVYGAAKLGGEHYALAYHRTYRMPVLVVRPFNAYGPRAHERGDLAEVIPRFTIRLLNGLAPVIFGDGETGRDFTYVTEIARGLASAAACDRLIGRIVNIAYGRMVTVNEIAATLAELCGVRDLHPIHIENRPGDVHKLHADTTLARDLLGYEALIDIRTGLQRYVDWFRAHHNDLASLLEDEPRNWSLSQTRVSASAHMRPAETAASS
jgi:UDP-glucose 4-epimerase